MAQSLRFCTALAIIAACGVAVLAGSPARAATTISLNPGNLAVGGIFIVMLVRRRREIAGIGV